MEVESQENQETIPETEAVDSYDELAAAEPEIAPKRGRGRPKGSKNKPKETQPPPPPGLGVETTEVAPPVRPEESEEIDEVLSLSPPPTLPRPRKSRAKPQQIPAPLDVEFHDGYGATGPPSRREKPVRMKRNEPPRAQSVPTSTDLMHVLAAFAKEHGTRDKERRRGFYEMYLPR